MTLLPLSAVREYSELLPLMPSCSRWNHACTPNGAPVRRWQARQWHIDILTGSPLQVMRTFPQAQVAVP